MNNRINGASTCLLANTRLSSGLTAVIIVLNLKRKNKEERTPITFLHHCIKLLLHILLNTSGWISGDAFWRQPGVPNSLHFPWPSTFNFADFSHYWSAQTIDGQIPFSHTSKKRALICISFGYRTHHNGVKIFMDQYLWFQKSYLYLNNYSKDS